MDWSRYFRRNIIIDLNDIAKIANLALATLTANATLIEGDLGSLRINAAFTTLNVNASAISTYTAGVLPNWDACTILINDLGLLQPAVSNFWIDLDTSSVASVKTVRGDGTNAALNAAGLVADASLIVKGWTTIHN